MFSKCDISCRQTADYGKNKFFTPKKRCFTPNHLTKQKNYVINVIKEYGNTEVKMMFSDNKPENGNERGPIELLIKLVKFIEDLLDP